MRLRGVDQNQWLERLEAEAGNLAATVGWYLAHDRGPLPHLFRVLWAFWFLRDHMGETRAWVGQLLPTADALDPQARAELPWTATVTTADRATTRRRFRPASAWHRCWTRSPTPTCTRCPSWPWLDLAGHRRLRRHPAGGVGEPGAPPRPERALWTALALITVDFVGTTVGRHDDALRHLTEARELAERFDNAWLAAWSRALLSTLALVRAGWRRHGRC